MRVLHCPLDTGGNAWGLSRAERALGIDSTVLVLKTQWFGHPNDIDLHFERGSKPAKLARLLPFFARALSRYDVFHFNWGASLFDYWPIGAHLLELPLLKRLGKKVLFTFQGCDARQKTVCRSRYELCACFECDVRHCNAEFDAMRKKRIDRAVRYADKVYVLNPDLLRVIPEAQLQLYASVNPKDFSPSHRSAERPVRILHLPTKRSIKGTRYVVEACETLKGRGHDVELELVEGVPHREVKERLERADIVVDQLLIGWYGAVATEAMAMKRPVLCFLRQEDLDAFVPFADQIPIVNTTPSSIVDNLERLLVDTSLRTKLGEQGRAYVEAFHDPLEIARSVIADYQR